LAFILEKNKGNKLLRRARLGKQTQIRQGGEAPMAERTGIQSAKMKLEK